MVALKLSSREIARQAIRDRIQQVAEMLFAEHGYRDTTVGAIATGVGISERTFFRYFATKDDLLFWSFAADTQWVIDTIDAHPVSDDTWDTLHAVVQAALGRLNEEAQRRAALFQRIAAESPHVSAAYLTHLQAFQRRIAEALWLRSRSNLGSEASDRITEGRPGGSDERIVLYAVVSSVFAAISEVTSLSSDRTAAEQQRLIHATLTAMRPSHAGTRAGTIGDRDAH
ncbi:TetR/AcrR family transcriptional regulator [Microbacterium sp. Root61]|uniref:TetR/AcrR family transcriptional regulator n=1 Tax=Microbacterium sp. Root61 TaxID=1736570 RepID=UPI0006F82EFE|nr:TetR family transcriptional regulator [Microbacterium sp. Root61]